MAFGIIMGMGKQKCTVFHVVLMHSVTSMPHVSAKQLVSAMHKKCTIPALKWVAGVAGNSATPPVHALVPNVTLQTMIYHPIGANYPKEITDHHHARDSHALNHSV